MSENSNKPRDITVKVPNKTKKTSQEARNSIKNYPDQEKAKLQVLAISVQKEIEEDGSSDVAQRIER
jgi:hypothetical protein